ncbi:asparagine synthase (glutamine-hydrolyzing), partial [bacterium]|nr:asparagine synthase (glutamine-hydrolyzing) [bacterium]
TESLVHRGPDEDGFFLDDGISLGMRRLAIVDLATGKQPVHNEDKTIWAVFNGELYNFPELRLELERRGHRFYTDHSDSELIVHLYEEYGAGFPNHVNGMFAIAVWDATSRKLLLVRDRIGVKPLFYAQVGQDVLFGSEIKALLIHPRCPREMDCVSIYHYLSFKNVPAPLTAFKGIRQLRPGEMLVFEDGRLDLRRWWQVRFEERADLSREEAEETIRELLDDATAIRMRCDVPFGAYLSGGVDSSTVVSIMSRHATRPIETFSLGYEDELANKQADLYHARRVAEQFGANHHEYIMSSSELAQDLPAVIRAFDQPFSGTVSTFFLSKLITQHVKVAISGDGADELFGSYLSHRLARPMSAYPTLREAAQSGTLTAEQASSLIPC